ncbi:U4/U6 small nuclear ribonucleoprotein Prp3 isoform X2 [Ixodes scapularis]|uniref:U4/U6 small nuclear ribonucleoprotein Prp3 n=1 Tax=Ixodes ricinus TaxID=34613 RepID=V5IG47_IXORI|nr:U4/U6 small nuclear ribonucleoprotein Prp3 isoform X2 [Ixodes scapularis]XP_040358875.1 U4/U6 small nuclear ribonucleoprotein Prp3 isoform X2 [Ixodes scapularis]
MALSRKDVEELKPWIDRTVEKFLGFNEPTLVTAAVSCLSNGYDKRKTTDKLSSLLDDAKAAKLSEQLFETIEDLKVKQKMKKKKEDDSADQRKTRFSEGVALSQPGQPSPGQLTAIQIKEMMANAQRMIEERKRALGPVAVAPAPPVLGGAVPLLRPGLGAAPVAPLSVGESRNRIAELTAQIQAKLGGRPGFVGALPSAGGAPSPAMPTPLILNAEGRTVDLSGKEVQLAHHTPTLKANIRAQKREQFKIHQEKVVEDVTEQKFYDHRVSAKSAQRSKKLFKFHEKGKYEQLAQRLRTKAKLEKLQQEIAQAAKKTGISSATKIALMVPKKEIKEGEIPDVEWWDTFIIKGESYDSVIDSVVNSNVKFEDLLEGVTNLVEHPIQMKAPTATVKPVLLPVYLTKKERKKLRRQNRREAWKEKQEKIRLGLEPPPEPKVRMSNLMRVLGTQQVQDPTKIEAHVREQMAKRQKAHEEANASRKLTTEQRREKKVKKLKEDTSRGVHVSVYRLLSLTNPAKKFKVEMNAKQLFLTGCVVLYRNVNLVVVEGGPRQQKKYRRLMMGRIKWAEDQASADGSENGQKVENRCILVWEGTVKSRSFGEMKFKVCPTECFAREHFKKHGVEHYWDLAYSNTILELADETA